jgi:hypothetical protein
VEVLSRDRGGECAEAARRAAPHAVQVADRFHLLKNLRDVVSWVFRQHEEILDLVPTPMNHFQRLTNLRLDRASSKERTREKTREFFESIHALSKQGIKNAQVARELGIHRYTVKKYLVFETPPQRRHFTKKVSAIASYENYILGRWEQGCRNVTHKSGGRSPSKAIPVPTRTSLGSLATSKSRSAWQAPSRASAWYLSQPCGEHPGEATGEPLRRRDTNTEGVEDGPPSYGAMLHPF